MSTRVALKDPQELYLDWEHAHWAAQDIDLSRDPADWAGLEESERELLYFALSSLMVAEERISTQFCGLVLAQDDEEEGSFLSTQLVDEVRHMQFYARFQDEVIADPATIAAHVARAREVLGEPFKQIFDEALVQAHDRLRRDPARPRGQGRLRDDLPHGHRGHARPGHFALPARSAARARAAARLRRRLLAGSRSDEQRHIAYGTWFLREAVQPRPSAWREVVRDRLLSLLPAVAEAVSPPSEGAFDALGVDDGALAAFGLDTLNRRLTIIGVSLDSSG